MNRLLRLKEVLKLVGLSKSEIYRLISLNRFPTPIHIGDRAVAFTESSIEEWIQSKIDISSVKEVS
jgi:prophage regulatory protein